MAAAPTTPTPDPRSSALAWGRHQDRRRWTVGASTKLTKATPAPPPQHRHGDIRELRGPQVRSSPRFRLARHRLSTKTELVNTPDVHVRRVGFRAGTDADLTALHAVEAPVEAERRPDRVPQPVESYIAFARSLPTQFDDHAWLVETSEGTPIASAFCWSNAAGDPRVMECDLFVRRDRRREGVGSRLLTTICGETAHEGRSLLTWSTFERCSSR